MDKREKMRAIVTTRYGPPEVLRIQEVDKPRPREDEVLIKIRAIAVTSGDCRLRAFNPPSRYLRLMMRVVIGFTKPRRPIQGLWFAGVVEDTGEKASDFQVGQPVYARTLDLKFGANAAYICLPRHAIMGRMPRDTSFEEAASIPFGALTALYFLRKSKVKEGDRILIYGASGAVGTAAVQLGKHLGAEVTAVCSTDNIEWVQKLGADRMIDYTKESLADGAERYDLVFDAVGCLDRAIVRNRLKPAGRFVSVLHSGHAQGNVEGLKLLTDLVEKGRLRPVVDRCYAFEDMAEAHRYVDKGRKRGNVVVRVGES